MRGAPAGAQLQPQDPARGEAEAVVRRLTVDEKRAPLAERRVVGHSRAVAAALLADDEEKTDTIARTSKAIGGRDLRREDPFRVAGAAPVQAVAFDPARKERGDAIEVRREGDRRRLICCATWAIGTARAVRCGIGDDVEARVVDPLLDDRPAPAAQIVGQPASRCPFTSGGRVDVDERSRQADDVDVVRCHATGRITTSNAEHAAVIGRGRS